VSKFLVTYHGGSGVPVDPSQAEAMKAAFGQWLESAGGAVTDPGAPLRPATQVANESALPRVAIAGYSVIEASDVDEVTRILRTHPFVARGGTLQVDEAVVI
jgi:hypothetical protein